MIQITITIGEVKAPDKTRGMLLCTTKQSNPTKEEHIIEAMVFQHVRLIGQELSDQRGAKVSIIEGTGKGKGGDNDIRGRNKTTRRGNL